MEFSRYVLEGCAHVARRDKNSWELGDLAVRFTYDFQIEVRPGRPVDPEAPTLSDLAEHWDQDLARVSTWHKVSRFYWPPKVRTCEVSWSHYSKAIKYSDGKLDNALELLEHAKAEYLGVRAFETWLKGDWYAGPIHRSELPERLQTVFPVGKRTAWLTLKGMSENGSGE